MGRSLIVSVPPAIPASIKPVEILALIMIAAERLVPHALCMLKAGVSGDNPDDNVDSRARFQSLEWFITAPSETSPMRCPLRSNRSTIDDSTLLIMSWLEH